MKVSLSIRLRFWFISFKQQFKPLQINVGNTQIKPSLSAHNLEVILVAT